MKNTFYLIETTNLISILAKKVQKVSELLDSPLEKIGRVGREVSVVLPIHIRGARGLTLQFVGGWGRGGGGGCTCHDETQNWVMHTHSHTHTHRDTHTDTQSRRSVSEMHEGLRQNSMEKG